MYFDLKDCDSKCDNDILYIEDITGTIGEWLSKDSSDIDPELMQYLSKAYELAIKKL